MDTILLKRTSSFLLILLLASLIGGVYGIIHDQLTYSISPEYYTKFKFYQFGLRTPGDGAIFHNPRLEVSIVGFFATWWMGLVIGFILGLAGLVHTKNGKMLKVTLKAFCLTICIAFAIGLIGLGYGVLYLANTGVDWWLPSNLVDVKSFIAVGSMHNFSYLGGLIGTIVAAIYSMRQKHTS